MNLRKFIGGLALACLPATLVVSVGTDATAIDNSTTLQVVDRAAEAGLEAGNMPTWDICVGDWDGDGRTDAAISRHMEKEGLLFLQRDGGVFVRELAGTIMPKVVRRTSTPTIPKHTGVDRHACEMADLTMDGLTDLITTAGRYASNRQKHPEIDNELFAQQADGSVIDMAIAAGTNEPCQRSRYIVVADWDGDGAPDQFNGAQKERDIADPCNAVDSQGVRIKNGYNEQSHVFLNKGDGGDGTWDGLRAAPQFDVSANNVGAAMALAWDQDHNGKPDLLALSFPNKKPLLFRNTGYSFTEVSQLAGIKLPVMNNATIGDVTGDGIDDLVFADNTGFAYRAGTATGVSTITVRIGTLPSNADGSALALGDADGDGDLDVYGQTFAASGTSGNPDDILYVNNSAGMSSASFTEMTVPSAGGASNDVAAITIDGVAQFLVTNGDHGDSETSATGGPIQLIALQPESGGGS